MTEPYRKVAFVIKNLLRRLAGEHVSRLIADNIRAQALLYSVAVIAMIVVAGTTSAVAWIMRYIVDSMTNPDDRAKVFMVSGAVVLIFFVKGIASYIQVVALTRAGNRIVANQQTRLYAKLLRNRPIF